MPLIQVLGGRIPTTPRWLWCDISLAGHKYLFTIDSAMLVYLFFSWGLPFWAIRRGLKSVRAGQHETGTTQSFENGTFDIPNLTVLFYEQFPFSAASTSSNFSGHLLIPLAPFLTSSHFPTVPNLIAKICNHPIIRRAAAQI